MKSKVFFLCLILCAAVLALASCGNDNNAFAQAEKNGCTVQVTYDLGTGTVNGNNTLLYLVEKDALLPELGTASGTTMPVLAGYRLTGYYTEAADGTKSDWDFSTDRVTGDVTLFAKWEKNFTVKILYGENNGKSYSVDFSPEKPTLASFRQTKWSGHTFYGFFYDAEYTMPVSFPYTHGLDSANATETVYAKYLEGNYTVIRSASDFKGAINAGSKYYLDADVDLTGVSVSVADTFSGSFIGNGHKITGLSVTRTQSKTSDSYGLFGTVASSAVFSDVTFENFSVRVTLGNEQNAMISHIGAFAGTVQSGATFDRLTLSGSLTYDCAGRDLTDKLVVGETFADAEGIDTTGVTATVSVSEATD